MAEPLRLSIQTPESSGGAFPLSTAIRSSRACLPARRRKVFVAVELENVVEFQSEYLRNTAIVSTVISNREGATIRVTDFAPRFRQFGRIFRPPQLFRIIEPLGGLPRDHDQDAADAPLRPGPSVAIRSAATISAMSMATP